MRERGINVPVVLGGAALTRRYVEDDLRTVYDGKLFYAQDAFSGLHVMDELTTPAANGDAAEVSPADAALAAANAVISRAMSKTAESAIDEEDVPVGEDAKLGLSTKPHKPGRLETPLGDTTHTTRSNIRADVAIPRAPFYGQRVVTDIPLDEVFAFVNETALFKGQWQFKQGKTTALDYKHLVKSKVRPMYDALKERCKREELLQPKVVYGFFPCQSQGNDLIVYEDDERTERVRFTFPRQPSGQHLCLADYFASVESNRIDTVGCHLVTMGKRASEHAQGAFQKRQLRRLSALSRSLGRISRSPRRTLAQAHTRTTRHRRSRRARTRETLPSRLSRLTLQLRLPGVS
jgi:5-methyltetrahydrofolate--homocysteine methyltransferase